MMDYVLLLHFFKYSPIVLLLLQYTTINESKLAHSPMDQYEMAYSQALIEYNTAILNGDTSQNLVDKFAAVVVPFHDSVSIPPYMYHWYPVVTTHS